MLTKPRRKENSLSLEELGVTEKLTEKIDQDWSFRCWGKMEKTK